MLHQRGVRSTIVQRSAICFCSAIASIAVYSESAASALAFIAAAWGTPFSAATLAAHVIKSNCFFASASSFLVGAPCGAKTGAEAAGADTTGAEATGTEATGADAIGADGAEAPAFSASRAA